MSIGLSALRDIGSNYYMRLNDKEVLVLKEDELRNSQLTDAQKLDKKIQEESEDKKIKEPNAADKLSEDEERLVRDLASRDSEVRAHEAAHQAAGGGMVGAASYTYQQGPDGKMYAIGGEVSVSMKAGSTPEETIANAKQIAIAAMAAGNPSPQDFAVASSARVMEMKAQQQLAREQQEELIGKETYSNQANKTQTDIMDDSNRIDLPA